MIHGLPPAHFFHVPLAIESSFGPSNSMDAFHFQEPVRGLFIRDEGAAGGGVFGPAGFTSPATLIQKAGGLRAQLSASGQEQREGLMADYRTCLDFLPYGHREGVREILGGLRLTRGWIDGTNEKARTLGLREYPHLVATLAEKITREALDNALNHEIDPETAWHSDRLANAREAVLLISILNAMPGFARLTLKTVPEHEFGQFVAFNVYTLKENFDALARVHPNVEASSAYRKVSGELMEQLAYALLEILATSKDFRRLPAAHQALMGLLPLLPGPKAEEADAIDSVMLAARQLSQTIAVSTRDDQTYAAGREFALALSTLPDFVIRHLIYLHVETVQTVCKKRAAAHGARLLATLILLTTVIEFEENTPSLVQMMSRMAELMPLLPPTLSAPHLSTLHEAWGRIFSAKLAAHTSPFVRDAAQATALHLHRLRGPSRHS